MPFSNGTSSGGGNGSVFWSVTHGNREKGEFKKPKKGNGSKLGRGEVRVENSTDGHDDTEFKDIGKPDQPGCFTVRLRFRYEDWGKIPETTRKMIDAFGQESIEHGSWFLEIHVPAIERKQPENDGQDKNWEKMPWEIQWGW